jgi:hypothetical protein
VKLCNSGKKVRKNRRRKKKIRKGKAKKEMRLLRPRRKKIKNILSSTLHSAFSFILISHPPCEEWQTSWFIKSSPKSLRENNPNSFLTAKYRR